MSDETTKTEVVNNSLEHRYEVWHGDRLAGVSVYRERGDRTVFVHTEIDAEFEGKGLGSVLAKHAIEDTIGRGHIIVPVCPFISAYLRRHPEYEEHVEWPGAAQAAAGDGA